MRRAYGLVVGLLCSCSEAELVDPPPSHELLSHPVPAATGMATGDFAVASLEHGRIPIDASLVHLLNFLPTPMLPPARHAVPSHGPLILYSDNLDVWVFSPLDHFFESLIWVEDGEIRYGLAGELDAVVTGFDHRFVLVKGKGINRTVEEWGALLRADHGTTAPDRYADRGLSQLGYWTDNGAYYYYKTETGMNEADTLLAVKRDADQRGIPYGYLQLDSWWYEKSGLGGNRGGVKRWEPLVDMFPDGLESFEERLGLPLILHNRWFARDNDYRASHAFVDGQAEDMSLPMDRGVFDELFANAKRWGAFTYEQDWLDIQYWGVAHLRNGVGHSGAWMGAMDGAALDHGLTLQLCMPNAAHLMDAIDRAAVTTVRTSIDYAPEAPKTSFWPQFHTVNMLAGALGIWPFKDNFHSSERWGEQEALISIMSAGMVGAGDKLGAAIPEILLRTARKDGLLLKPDRPATPIDAMFLPHTRPYLTSTYSDRGALGRWRYLAAFQLDRSDEAQTQLDDFYAIVAYSGGTLADMFVLPERITDWHVDLARDLGIREDVVVYDWQTRTAALAEEGFELRPTNEPFAYRYVVIAPVLENGMAFLGEPDKLITLADQRYDAIELRDDDLYVRIAGVPGETVELLAYDTDDERLIEVTLELGAGGSAEATITP